MTEPTGFRDTSCRIFSGPGPKNTRAVLDIVLERARTLDISKALIPTCSGKTALEAADRLLPEVEIVAVSHVTGFQKPDHQELEEEARQRLMDRGITVLTAQHAFGGVGRGIRNKLGTYQVDEIIAYALRMFGQGTKVAVELALMAADAGLIRTDEDIVSTGGTARGIDTALVIRPANSFHVFDLKIRELICKPFGF
jgi:hypothetical protein